MSDVAIPQVFDTTFTDPDELEETFNLRRNVRVIQLASQPFRCQISQLDLGLAELLFIRLNTPIRILGDKTPGWLDFDFVMPPTPGALISHGLPLRYDTVFGFNNAWEIDMVLPENLVLGALQVKREVIEDYVQIMERTDLTARFWATNSVQSPETFAPVQRYLRELYGLVQQRADFLNQSQINQLLLADYLPLLIEAIPPTGSSAKATQHGLTRSQLVRQAEEYMLAHLEEPITLKDLYKVLSSSKTPLNCGFQEVFGVSPMVYLRQLRLHAIHQILKAADPTTTQVADVAHRFGFWHGGRFSQYYQQMFGQPPSTTLKQG